MPPELDPQIARISGSPVIASEYLFVTNGMASLIKNFAYASPSDRIQTSDYSDRAHPRIQKMAIVTGISLPRSGYRTPPALANAFVLI